MSQTLGQLGIAIALLSSGSAAASDIVLSVGSSGSVHRIPYASVARLAPQEGDVFVRPVASAGVAGDGWCPSSGGSSAPDGPAVVLQLADGASYRIPFTGDLRFAPDSGDVEVTTIAESGVAGDAWCTQSTPGNDSAVAFTQLLRANPTKLPAGGGSFTLAWAVDGATQCTANSSPAVQGWSGNVPSTGVANLALTTSGNYTFELTCSDAHSTASARRTVVVAYLSATANCTGRPPVPGLIRQTSMVNPAGANPEFPVGATVSLLDYVPILGTYFAAPGQMAKIYVDSGKYAALRFDTAELSAGVFGELQWQPGGSSGPLWVTISPCPGDFESMTDTRCRAYGGWGALMWMIEKPNMPEWICPLQPATIYYVNAVFSSEGDYRATSCQSARCEWWITSAGRMN